MLIGRRGSLASSSGTGSFEDRAPTIVHRSKARCAVGLAIALSIAALSPVTAFAADNPSGHLYETMAPSRMLVVTLYKSQTLQLDRPFATAVVGAPEIADVLPMTDRGLYIQGKKIGTTNISIFNPEQKLVAV